MALALEGLTGRVIGAAIAVHRALGPGFVEAVYENALTVELKRRGMRVERQRTVPVLYRGVEVGRHRLDLLVEGQLVVELKATRSLDVSQFATVRSYLRAIGRQHGLLLNFAKRTLQIRRVLAPA